MTARLLVGHVLDALEHLEDGSVDLLVTSPPFLNLRAYLPDGHADKALEIGSEATPAEFLDSLLDVVEAVAPKLAAHATICVELGDSYSGSGGAGGDYNPGGLRDGQPAFRGTAAAGRTVAKTRKEGPSRYDRRYTTEMGTRLGTHSRADRPGYPSDKSLTMLPTLFAASLAYGWNMLDPDRGTPRWRVRNLSPWIRSNPPVGDDGDKFRPATSYVTVACVGRSRYFDGDAVRKAYPTWTRNAGAGRALNRGNAGYHTPEDRASIEGNPNGAPQLDWFDPFVLALDEYLQAVAKNDFPTGLGATTHLANAGLLDTGDALRVPTEAYPGSHYATFPRRLVAPLILAMCPRHVCLECGEPRRRIVRTTNAVGHSVQRTSHREDPHGSGDGREGVADINKDAPDRSDRETVGWSDCGHDAWRPGLVLDPFAGSGTTLEVATGQGLAAVGIDLDERNVDLVRDRVGGLLLEVEEIPRRDRDGVARQTGST